MMNHMDIFSLLFIATGLAMDCFAVSLGVGTTDFARSKRAVFRLSYHFGLFQGGMTLLGWLVGNSIAQYIAGIDHWVAAVLLGWVGMRMIIEGYRKTEKLNAGRKDPSRGGTLVMLSLATSLDAMAVGLSLAMLKVNIIGSSLVIGFVSLVMTVMGLRAGRSLSQRFGKRMEVLGGVVLIIIGFRILYAHII
jgi:putative Mn2+ efflux pump MntP